MSDIKKMSVIERLQAMEALWDSLTHDITEMESPEWHGKILDGRRKVIENGSAKIISLDELKSTSKE